MKKYMANKEYIIDDARLMAEWDWEENENCNLDPRKLTLGSGKKVNWVCSKGHKWSTSVYHRVVRGTNCPYCSNKRVLAQFSATPENISLETLRNCAKEALQLYREIDAYAPDPNAKVAVWYDALVSRSRS